MAACEVVSRNMGGDIRRFDNVRNMPTLNENGRRFETLGSVMEKAVRQSIQANISE